MLHQSLPLNNTTGALAEYAQNLRQLDEEQNLMGVSMTAAVILLDVMEAAGFPYNLVRLILTEEEMEAIGVKYDPEEPQALCQRCGCEEAQQLVKVRGSWMLLGDDCLAKVPHS